MIVARVGNSHTQVLTQTGRVWCFGNNRHGKLGTGSAVDSEFGPQPVAGALSYVRVVHISCGDTHTLAVAETGRMFSWGFNDSGQLGLGHMTSCSTPTLIEGAIAQEQVVFTASSTVTNAAVTSSNAIWLWGMNGCGQMGPIAQKHQTLFQDHPTANAVPYVLAPAPMLRVRHMLHVHHVRHMHHIHTHTRSLSLSLSLTHTHTLTISLSL